MGLTRDSCIHSPLNAGQARALATASAESKAELSGYECKQEDKFVRKIVACGRGVMRLRLGNGAGAFAPASLRSCAEIQASSLSCSERKE